MSKSHFAPEGYTRLTINLPTELHQKVKIASVLSKKTIGEIISEFIKDELELLIKKGSK